MGACGTSEADLEGTLNLRLRELREAEALFDVAKRDLEAERGAHAESKNTLRHTAGMLHKCRIETDKVHDSLERNRGGVKKARQASED